MSYIQKEEKQKDKVKALEDHIVIEATPNLNNNMNHSDSRIFTKPGSES